MEAKIGKREPLPGAGKPPGPNWEKKKEAVGASSSGSLGDPLGLKKNLRERMQNLSGGGKVRGCGAAKRGLNFKTR
jgi:hypothetical protein